MQAVDKQQQSSINHIIAAVAVITAIIGFLTYRNNKQHQELEQKNLAIDKEIKLLQLAKAKNDAKKEASI